MSNKVKFLTACVICLMMAACSRSIHAPVGSRRNKADSPPSSRTTAGRSEVIGSYSASKADVYVVRRGDTVFSIAGRNGIGFRQLAKINGIRFPYIIRIGQRLRLKSEPEAAVVTAPVVTAPVAKVSKPKPVKPAPTVVQKKEEKPAPPKAEPVISFDSKWQWPTRGRLLRGYRPNEPGKKGIYIGGHSGQPVKAAASGKVVYVGSGLVGYGRLIIIRHDEYLLSTYGHNSELLVEEGEYVKAGQMIAKMGSSSIGRNELYFEIRKEGKPVDPSKYLPKQP